MTHVENATDSLVLEVKRKLASAMGAEKVQSVTSPVRKTAKIEITPKIIPAVNSSSVMQRTVTQTVTDGDKTEKTTTRTLTQDIDNKKSTEMTTERKVFGGRPQTSNSNPKGFHSIRFQPSTIAPGIKPTVWSSSHKPIAEPEPAQMTTYKKTTTTTQVHRTCEDSPDAGGNIKQFNATFTSSNKPKGVWSPAATSTPAKESVGRTWTPTSRDSPVLKEIKINNVESNSSTWTTPVVHKANTIEISFTAPRDTTSMVINDDENTSPIPPAPPTPPIKESANLNSGNGNGVIEDPSVILRNLQAGIPVNPNEFQAQVSIDGDVHPEDVRKACKTISDLLLFPTNKNTKGARMFAKRRKRSAKWTLESVGQGPDETVTTTEEVFHEESTVGPAGGVSMFPPGFIPLPPTLPPVRKLLIEPIDFNVNLKSKEKCKHDVIPPAQCNMLVQDLLSQSGRGAQMFEKRRKRSEKYVVPDKPKMTSPQVVLKKPEREEPVNVSLEFIAMQGVGTGAIGKPKMTPWEAASKDPKGRVDAAFDHLNPMSKPLEFTKKFEKPKPPASWMQSSNIVPDFRPKKSIYSVARPTFKADEIPSEKPATQNGELPPRFHPKFDARNAHPSSQTDNTDSPGLSRVNFHPNPRSWTSPDSTPGIVSPPSSECSLSNEFKPNAGLPTVPFKTPNYNSKPRGFRSPPTRSDSPRDRSSPATGMIMESDDL
ncbi:mucin-12-like isoform X2 [Anneissia japonica]|nr:mucin-12-like isoform X2 [Anneissia japonica]